MKEVVVLGNLSCAINTNMNQDDHGNTDCTNMYCILSSARLFLGCAHRRNAQLAILTHMELEKQAVQQYCQKLAVQHYWQTWADLERGYAA